MSEAKEKEVKGAQSSAPATSPQGGGDQDKAAAEAKAQAEAKAKEEAKAAAEAKADKKPKKYTVISPFADRDNFGKLWKEGDDVSHFSTDRLKSAIDRGLVKKG